MTLFQVMQFGRIDGNAYTLDFQYPFSALQAFAVALANVTQRLKWELSRPNTASVPVASPSNCFPTALNRGFILMSVSVTG